jgi:hypothetical protein
MRYWSLDLNVVSAAYWPACSTNADAAAPAAYLEARSAKTSCPAAFTASTPPSAVSYACIAVSGFWPWMS